MKIFNKLLLIVVALAVVVINFQTEAHAGVAVGIGVGGWWRHGRVSISGYVPLSDYYWDRYYYPPYYYPVPSYTYVIERPPAGAIVYAIPVGYRQVVVNGINYYEYNGTYYLPVAGGYQVVVPPVLVTPATATTLPATAPQGTNSPEQQEFTVNIPNDKGGYSTVVIKRSGTGFTGPQGEYYAEFPKVSQLQVMYGK